ncbi:MAG: fatty acid hydroxylase [Saprospiraceae bacterium]|nr:fatty acid hydroxylase [Saprospiraceae bacterium]
MQVLTNILIVLATVATMEFVAWAAHKFLMHGYLWNWHEDHHDPKLKHGFFEKNDRFFLVFAVPSAGSFMASQLTPYGWLLYVGIGIAIYGAIYFLIHDVYIHRRFDWFKHLDNPYSRAILRAHGAHHAKKDKEDGESFGLLVVHPKYFKKRSEWKKYEAHEHHH